MKTRIITTLAISFLACLFGMNSPAGEIWSIGKNDSSYGEFFGAEDYEAVAKKYPDDIRLTLRDATNETKTVFPWILPGPGDTWAGSKPHALALTFDREEKIEGDTAGCRLEIRGISQQGKPPVLEIDLNGVKETVRTVGGRTGDRILETTDGAEWRSYQVIFPFDKIKEKGNTLSIKTVQGCWIVFDSLRFSSEKGIVDRVAYKPVRGVLRGENDTPIRRIRLEYEGGVLGQPATLELTASLKSGKPIVVQLTPEKNLTGAEADVPVTLEDLSKEIVFRASLKQTRKNGSAIDPITTEFTVLPEKKWEVYLVHQTHLDIGYTHVQTDILARQIQSLRDALKYIEETKDYPEEAKFRFHPEGMWAVEAFLKEATEEEKAAFVKAARNRDIHLDGMYAQAMTGMYNDEELFELFIDAARFCRENDIVLDSVMQTDVPGYTWGLVTAMAQNGIKYMTMGPNPGHRLGHLYHWGDRPFWWVSQSGKEKVLCWLLDTGYHQFHGRPLGHVISEDEVFRLLQGKDTWMPRPGNDGRKFLFEDLVMIRYGIEGDNGRPNRVLSDMVKEWNEKYLYPRLVISRNSDVMRILEERYGDKLPVLRGDYTPYWEDGSASTTEATAINRRACERIVQAGALWAMFDPKNYPAEGFTKAWIDLIMYDEHTWGAHNSISAPDSDFVKTQDDYKQEYARRGSREVDALVNKVAGQATEKMLLANTLTRERKGICFIGKAPLAEKPASGLQVYKTAAGKTVLVQYVDDPDGKGTCSLYADFGYEKDSAPVPALGALELTKTDTKPQLTTPFSINAETGELGGRKIKLVVDKDSGAIRSMKIAGNDHEFVDAGTDGNRGLNDYLYIIGRNAAENRARNEGKVKLTVVANGPLVASLLIETEPDSTPNALSFKRQITIFEDSEKVKLENVLDKKMERRPEGTLFGFPFSVPGGKWLVDGPWSLVEVEKDQIPGANRNFYCVQRYCSLAGENRGVNWVTVDANMAQFAPVRFTGGWFVPGEQWRTAWPEGQPGGTIYSWVCNNHWETNYKAGQEGLLTFEYWIWPYVDAPFDNGVAQRFARQVHQPLLRLAATDKTVSKSGLLTLENEGNVIVTGLRPTRDGSGALQVRLFNPTRETQQTTVALAAPYKSVFLSNPMEDKFDAAGKIELAPMETVTLRIE